MKKAAGEIRLRKKTDLGVSAVLLLRIIAYTQSPLFQETD